MSDLPAADNDTNSQIADLNALAKQQAANEFAVTKAKAVNDTRTDIAKTRLG